MQKSCGSLQVCVGGFRICKTKQTHVAMSIPYYPIIHPRNKWFTTKKKKKNIQTSRSKSSVTQTLTLSTEPSPWQTKFSHDQPDLRCKRLHRGLLRRGVKKSSCEGSQASKPTTYATTPCGHRSCRWLPTLEMHTNVEETQRHQLVRAEHTKVHHVAQKYPQPLHLCKSPMVLYKSVQVDLGYAKQNKPM